MASIGTRDEERRAVDTPPRRAETVTTGRTAEAQVERQHERFGGFNLGAAFFGWLVAMGLTALLTALLGAAGAAIGITELSDSEAAGSAETLSLVGAILFFAVLAVGYFAGGYVAGRMSRFDGARQGLGVWGFGLAVTLLLAAAGAIFGSEYNLLGDLNLPRLPVDEGSLATGAAITLAAILIGTLIAAILGGKAGERYHRRVDRAGFEVDRDYAPGDGVRRTA